MTTRNANLLLLLAALIWGITFVPQKTALEHVSSLYYTGLRFLLGSVVVLPAIFWLQKRQPAAELAPEKIRQLQFSKVEWQLGIALGVVMFMGIYLQQISLESTSIAKSSFITGLYVVMVPLLGFFLGQKSSPLIIGCVAIACIGLYLLSIPPNFEFDSTAKGDFWALLGMFFFSMHVTLVGLYGNRGNPLHLSFIQFLVVGVLGLVLALAFGELSWPAIPKIALELLVGGLISVGFAFTLQIIGQRYTTASTAAIIMSLEAVFGALFGYLLLHEGLTMRMMFGAGLMFSAMLAAQLVPHWEARRRAALPLGK